MLKSAFSWRNLHINVIVVWPEKLNRMIASALCVLVSIYFDVKAIYILAFYRRFLIDINSWVTVTLSNTSCTCLAI